MYEIDFLVVESGDGPSGKSGDAITIRFTRPDGRQVIVLIDAGFQDTGDDVVRHVRKYYGTDRVDLVISTHPDRDHLNGLIRVIEQLDVVELLIHRPRRYTDHGDEVGNIKAVDELLEVAKQRGVEVTQPFTGMTWFEGQIRVLGPTEGYYKSLLEQHLDEERSGTAAARLSQAAQSTKSLDLLRSAVALPVVETLSDEVETSPRNDSSVIILVTVDGDRLLFTGDAGLEALGYAADEYEDVVGPFSMYPLTFFQVPHHGSRRNLGPSYLDRVLGRAGAPFAAVISFISSAAKAPKHPSPKVVNALLRRGAWVGATEGRKLWYQRDAPSRPDYSTVASLPPQVENEDD